MQFHGLVEQPFLAALVEPVAIDQLFVLDPGLDPVRAEEIHAFDVIHIVSVKECMGIFRRLDRHAVTRQHVKMGGPREGGNSGAGGLKGGFHKAPFPPAAFDAFRSKGDGGVGGEGRADAVVIGRLGPGVEMDGNEIPRRRQALRLGDDPLGVLVAEEDIGDAGHGSDGSGALGRSVDPVIFING